MRAGPPGRAAAAGRGMYDVDRGFTGAQLLAVCEYVLVVFQCLFQRVSHTIRLITRKDIAIFILHACCFALLVGICHCGVIRAGPTMHTVSSATMCGHLLFQFRDASLE